MVVGRIRGLVTQVKARFDKDLLYTGLNQLLILFSALVLFVLVPLLISEVEQGYWFTMVSLSALSVFADLGFSVLILQFSAHEFAHLQFGESGQIIGDELHLKRLARFFLFSLKWLVFISLLVFPVIFGAGVLVLSSQVSSVEWIVPWVVLVIAGFLDYICNNLLLFIEGLDSVAKAQKLRVLSSLTNMGCTILFLLLGFGLMTLSLAILVKASFCLALLFWKYRTVFSQLLHMGREFEKSWRKEVFQLFWRYAISYASGYLIFQIYTPLMFYFHGPVEAGKLGISLTLWQGVLNVSNIWITSVMPKMNMCASKRDWTGLDAHFKKNLGFVIATFLGIGAGYFFLNIILSPRLSLFSSIFGRFLENLPMVFLFVGFFLATVINALAIYLRAHKQEPLVHLSLVSGIYNLLTTIFTGLFLPPAYFMLGFLSNYFWSTPIVFLIFQKKRRHWHNLNHEEAGAAVEETPTSKEALSNQGQDLGDFNQEF